MRRVFKKTGQFLEPNGPGEVAHGNAFGLHRSPTSKITGFAIG